MKHAPFGTGCLGQLARRPLAALAVLTALLTSPLAQADEYADVAQLMRAEQLPQALSLVNKHLASKPRDPQMRFIKGVIQSSTGHPTDAIATFQALTVDFPELPEPYNNLAVLYADQGELDKARAALDMAVRTNPNYAIAYENLADVHLRLAAQHLNKVRQLDPSNTQAPRKLGQLQHLLPAPQPSASAK